MATTTSTSGSISVDITADSLTPAQNIVVREDIKLGSTIVGTTYRNISFTTTYVSAVPLLNGNLTSYSTSVTAVEGTVIPFTFSNDSTGGYDHITWSSTGPISISGTGNVITGTVNAVWPTVANITVTLTVWATPTTIFSTVTQTTSFTIDRLLTLANLASLGFGGTRNTSSVGSCVVIDSSGTKTLQRGSQFNTSDKPILIVYCYSNPSAAALNGPRVDAGYSAPLANTTTASIVWANSISTSSGYLPLATGIGLNNGFGGGQGTFGARILNRAWSTVTLNVFPTWPDKINSATINTFIPQGCGRVETSGVASFVSAVGKVLADYQTGTGSQANDLIMTFGADVTIRVPSTQRIGNLHAQARGTVKFKNPSTGVYTTYTLTPTTGSPIIYDEFLIPTTFYTTSGGFTSITIQSVGTCHWPAIAWMRDIYL